MSEDDLKWVGNGKKTIVIINQFHDKKIVLKPLVFRKLSHHSEMQNYALMHRHVLKGQNRVSTRETKCRVSGERESIRMWRDMLF